MLLEKRSVAHPEGRRLVANGYEGGGAARLREAGPSVLGLNDLGQQAALVGVPRPDRGAQAPAAHRPRRHAQPVRQRALAQLAHLDAFTHICKVGLLAGRRP